MSFDKGFSLFDNFGSENGILRVCHTCHGDTDHGADLSICGSISSPSEQGKWVV